MAMLYINSLSVIAPGMLGLDQALPILRGEQEWHYHPLDKIVPALLPANERRRTTPLIKLALYAGQEAMPDASATNAVATVFASSDGDMEIIDKICTALTQADKPVSPTLFHNSVHNAAAGYWAIAAQFKNTSVSLSAGEASFSAGMLEAATQLAAEEDTVLYIAYDHPAPPLLDTHRHFEFPFATAMLLSNEKTATTLAAISIESIMDAPTLSRCHNAPLEKMRQGNPIARSLPMLEAIVAEADSAVCLPYLQQQGMVIRICH